MELPYPPITATKPGTFAYKVMKDNLPIILSMVVDTLSREREKIAKQYETEDPDIKEKIKTIIGGISKLRNEVMTDKPFILFEDDRPDAKLWNDVLGAAIQKNGGSLSWYSSSWYLAECYLYRRLKELFHSSVTLKDYDPFQTKKMNALVGTLDTAERLGEYLLDRCGKATELNEENLEKAVLLFIQIGLWGNRFDLSLSCGEDLPASEDPISVIENLRKNLLVDESMKIWNVLKAAKVTHPGKVRLDVVMDNAGYEAFSDLVMVDFFITAGVISDCHFHVKAMPWFVSDVSARDVENMIEYLCHSNNSTLQILGERWKIYIKRGLWVIEDEPFWVTPYFYYRMKEVDPGLYEALSKSDLLLFKGDLNYRKITADLQWPTTATFKEALMGFDPCPVAILRTIKAELVTGFEPGQAEKTTKIRKDWMVCGQFAVIQCHNKGE